MSREGVEGIKQVLNEKTTEELLDIWTKNDRSEWREEAFVAIQSILSFRNVHLPKQEEYKPDQMAIEKKSTQQKELIKGLALILVGLFMSLFYVAKVSTVMPIGLIAVGIYILMKRYYKV